LDKEKFLIIDNAYHRLKSDMVDHPSVEPMASICLRDLEQDLQTWNGNITTIGFLQQYYDGDGPMAVAKIRIGRMYYPNFITFMNDSKIQGIVCDLLTLRCKEPMDYRIIRKIIENGFITSLEGYNFTNGNRPLIYGNRIMVLLFHKVMTLIVDRGHLENTGKRLGIRGVKELSFEALQNQVREEINDYIVEKKISHEPDFIKAAIAWWIIEANK